jgi:hypothetical protein
METKAVADAGMKSNRARVSEYPKEVRRNPPKLQETSQLGLFQNQGQYDSITYLEIATLENANVKQNMHKA